MASEYVGLYRTITAHYRFSTLEYIRRFQRVDAVSRRGG